MKSSTANKILSVVIALLLWMYVIIEVNPPSQDDFKDIPIQLINETALADAGLAIAGNTEYTVEVIVTGKHTDVVRLSEDDIVATASLFGYGKGKNQIQVEVAVPDGLTVAEVRPSKIQVVIEDLVAASKPIEVEVINLQEGEEEGIVEIQPQEIEVSGAKSLVNSVRAVQVTLDAAKLTSKEKSLPLSATAIDADGMPVENVRLSTNYVDVSAKLYSTKEVSLRVDVSGEPGKGMELADQVIPSKIKIKGPRNLLKDINSVQAEPVDISGITDNTQVKLVPLLPAEVELCRANETITAEFLLQNVEEQEFTFTSNEIVVEGLAPHYILNIQTPTISVVVSGSKNVMGTLKKEDLTPVVHAENVDSATITIPVELKYTVHLNSATVEPATVQILVNEVDISTNQNNEGQGNE